MLFSSPTPDSDPVIQCYEMKANPTGRLLMLSHKWLPRYGLLETFEATIPPFEDLLVLASTTT